MASIHFDSVWTHRWSHSLSISKWTLTRTQFPRIPQSSHRYKDCQENQLWAIIGQGDRPPHWSDCQNYSLPLFSVFSWILLDLPVAESWQMHFQQTQTTSPHTAVTQGLTGIPAQLAAAAVTQGLSANSTIWGAWNKLAPSCYPGVVLGGANRGQCPHNSESGSEIVDTALNEGFVLFYRLYVPPYKKASPNLAPLLKLV